MRKYYYTLTSKLKEKSELFSTVTELRQKYKVGEVTQIEVSTAFKSDNDFVYNGQYFYIESLMSVKCEIKPLGVSVKSPK